MTTAKQSIVMATAMTTLIIIGILMLLSTSSVIGINSYNDGYYFIKKHILFLCLGATAFFIGCRVPHHTYKTYGLAGFIGAVLLLGCTLIPGMGVSIGGASRWLDLGLVNIQPVEVMKFWIIVFIAIYIDTKKENVAQFQKGLLPVLVGIGLPIGILLCQPDLGNTGLILMVTFILLCLSNIPFKQLAMLSGGAVMTVLISILTYDYQQQRVKTFFSPWEDPLGKGYHIIQSFIAIGSGGILGLGLGQSKLKYYYLPLHYSDFIFAIICEEGGLLLALLICGLFLAMTLTGFRIAIAQTDLFSKILAMGLTLLIVLQGLLNIGVVIGLFPVTGIPLTFISFGGTSLIMSMFCVGVIININQSTNQSTPHVTGKPDLTA